MSVALYPGSFDPVHDGHVAVIRQTSLLFDSVVVGVGHNPDKPSGLFTPEKRAELIREAVVDLDNVRVELFTGLVTIAAVKFGADCLVKGIRGASDLDTEMQQAHMNLTTGSIGTVFVPATGSSALIAGTFVRQIAAMGGDIADVVPPNVAEALHQRFNV